MIKGMDFPGDIKTNVYKIEDVKEIYWALYAQRQDGKEQTQGASPEPEKRDAIFDIQDIAHSLRDQGNHVFLDESTCAIWIFCLSQGEKANANRFLASNDFECLVSGFTKSNDSAFTSTAGHGTAAARSTNTATPVQQPGGRLSESNLQTFQTNTSVTAESPLPSPDTGKKGPLDDAHGHSALNIYSKFMLALSQSMVYTLSKVEHYMQIGSAACVDVRSLGDADIEFLEISPAAKVSTTITCDVRWLVSGSLLFFLSERTVKKLCTIWHLLSVTGSSPIIAPGMSILLSPSGIVGQFSKLERTSNAVSQSRRKKEVKAETIAYYARHGLSVPQDCQWVHVLVATRDITAEHTSSSGEGPGAGSTLWPAQWCLCEDTSGENERSIVPAFLESLGGPDDPLKRAEAWFLGKNVRAEAIEIRRQRDLAEAERVKQISDEEEENTLDEWQPQIAQDITPRDVSGIYPTPPDGLPSSYRENSVSHDLQPAANNDEMDTVVVNDEKPETYHEPGNDELFGEMDSDLYATNGVTDEDFDFFDNPNVNDLGGQVFRDERSMVERSAGITAPPSPLPEDSAVEMEDNERIGSPDSLQISESSPIPAEEDYTHELDETGPLLDNNVFVIKQESVDKSRNNDAETPVPADVHEHSLLPKTDPPQEFSFTAVTFPVISSKFDTKYTTNGRYGFDFGHDTDDLDLEKRPPRFHRTPSRPGKIQTQRPNIGIDIQADDGSLPHVLRGSSSNISATDDTDEEKSSKSSNASMGRYSWETLEEDHPQIPRKRKRGLSEEQNLNQPATPLSSAPLTDTWGMPNLGRMIMMNALLAPNDGGHTDAFLKSESKSGPLSIGEISDKTFVQIAQMVVDQAISSHSFLQDSTPQVPHQAPNRTTELYQDVTSVLDQWSSKSGKLNKQCTFKDFVELDEDSTNAFHQKAQKLPHPERASSAAAQLVTKLQSSFACVQRSGTSIDIGSSALRFWEELSLAPFHGSKDVIAFCVYPAGLDIQEEVTIFLSMIKVAYQSCKLGAHDVGSDMAVRSNGLYAIPMGSEGIQDASFEMNRACEKVGLRLGRLKLEGARTVIYMMNPFEDSKGLPLLCTAFVALFDAYMLAIKDHNIDNPNDLVLQIVPAPFIYSSTAIVLQFPTDYRKLAFEVYDRCGPNDTGAQRRPQYISAPAIRLAKAVPKTIDFRLTPDNPALSLQNDSCLHIAYTWTPGEDWLTASWTDNLGILSWNACYCIGRGRDEQWQSFSEIAKEIWETTLKMLQPRNGPWRLLLCKAGSVPKSELDAWQAVVANSIKPPTKISVLFDFLTLDTDTLLDFPVQVASYSGVEVMPASLETPETTPQASVPSPDALGFSSTPGGAMQTSTPPPNPAFGDHDAEARLLDITDESWGMVATRGIRDSCTSSEYCPALASGYLMKRAGPRDEDGVVRVGVNIIHGQKPYRPLLKVVLGMYRNLGLLARLRGIADPVRGLEPLHITRVRKAHHAVNGTMHRDVS